MPDNIEQRIVITGDREIQLLFAKLEEAGTKAFDNIVKATTGLIKASAKTEEGLANIEKTANGVGRALSDISTGVGDVAKGLGSVVKIAATATAGLFAFTKSGADVADESRDMAASLGLTIGEFGKLSFALAQSGGGTNTARTAISKLSDIIGDALKGGKEGTRIFSELGISIKGVNGEARPTLEIISDISDKFQVLPDGARKTALAIEIFGQRAGPQLIPLLNEGRAGIQGMADDAERLGGVLTKQQGVIGDAFNDALGRLMTAIGGVRNSLTEVLAPVFTDVFNSLANLIADNRVAIAGIASFIVSSLVPAFVTVKDAFVTVFGVVFSVIERLTAAFNSMFGTNITAQQVVIIGLFTALASAVISVTTAILALVPGLAGLLSFLTGIGPVLGIITGSFRTLIGVISLFTSTAKVATLIFSPWTALIGLLIAALVALGIQLAQVDWTAFVAGINEAIAEGVARFSAFKDSIIGFFTDIRDYIVSVWNDVKDILSSLSGGGDGGTPAIGRAQGGPIYGPGTSTSDSVPIMASVGEFMMKARAVRFYGKRFMHMINNLELDPSVFGMKMGGLVPAYSQPTYRMAEGGEVTPAMARPPGNVLNLTIDREQFNGLVVEDDVMDKLTKFATRSQVRTTGRKPTWLK